MPETYEQRSEAARKAALTRKENGGIVGKHIREAGGHLYWGQRDGGKPVAFWGGQAADTISRALKKLPSDHPARPHLESAREAAMAAHQTANNKQGRRQGIKHAERAREHLSSANSELLMHSRKQLWEAGLLKARWNRMRKSIGGAELAKGKKSKYHSGETYKTKGIGLVSSVSDLLKAAALRKPRTGGVAHVTSQPKKKKRIGGTGSSGKGGRYLFSVHDAVEIPVQGKGKLRGIVVSPPRNFVYVLTKHGTFHAPSESAKKLRAPSVTFDWKKLHAQVKPAKGSWVNVAPLPQARPAPGTTAKLPKKYRSAEAGTSSAKLPMTVKRVLAGPLEGKGEKVKVAEVRPEHRPKVYSVPRSAILGPYVPEKVIDRKAGARTRVRPDKVKSKDQLKREATNFTYFKYLSPAQRENLLASEKAFFDRHTAAIETIGRNVARRMGIGGENVQDLISHAFVGGIHAFRGWERDRKGQKLMLLANIARRYVKGLGVDLRTAEGRALVEQQVKRLSKLKSDDKLREEHVKASAWMEAKRKADQVLDISGLSGINSRDIGKVVRAQREITAAFGHKPTVSMIAHHLGWDGEAGEAKVRLALARKTARAASRMSELEKEGESGERVSMEEKIAAPKTAKDPDDWREEARRAELFHQIVTAGQTAGLTPRQMLILQEGIHLDLDNAPKKSGAAVELAKQLRQQFGGRDTESSVLQEWNAIIRITRKKNHEKERNERARGKKAPGLPLRGETQGV